MICFVVAFVGRSGSSYLQGLLNSHPEVQCHGEIFGGKRFEPGRTEIRNYLDGLVHSSGSKASGFKLGVSHIRANGEIVDQLRQHSYRVIHVTRENRLDQFISVRLAQINGIWRSDRGAYDVHSFAPEPQLVAASVRALIRDDTDLLGQLEGFPTLRVTYEELVVARDYKGVLAFLDVSEHRLESPFFRQRRATRQRDALENYDELVKYFSGSDLERYFVE